MNGDNYYQGQQNWNGASNTSYQTPPPSGGSWNGPMQFPQNIGGSSQSQFPAYPQNNHPQPNMPNPMLMMMTMMQQMQNVAPQMNRTQQQQQQQQQQLPTLTAEQHKPSQQMNERKLAQVLLQRTTGGLSYKAAIETMHGHDGFAAYAWKDFYLEHKQRIDGLVEEMRQPANQRPNEVKREQSAAASLDTKSRDDTPQSQNKPAAKATPTPISQIKSSKKAKAEQKAEIPVSISSSRRRTMNSLSVTPATGLLALVPDSVPIDPQTGLPAAPSRLPDPPKPGTARNQKGRNTYTEEDAAYFYQVVAWEAAKDQHASKSTICDTLGELAPHHSAASWRTFWKTHEDVADKILMLSELDDIDRAERIKTWRGDGHVHTQTTGRQTKAVSYAEDSDSESAEEPLSEYDEDGDEEKDGDEDEDEDEDEDAIGSTDGEGEMGGPGTPFTHVEIRALAKHIATIPGWYKGEKDWSGFLEQYPQRTAASWREFYRRRHPEVDKEAHKYIKRAKRAETTSVSHQRGRPSWASNGSTRSINGPQKRKLDDRSVHRSEEKRVRSNDHE